MSETGHTLSIALCTYNGARFLREQLDSIAAQTRPPDELVICDDGSTDDTLTIAEQFAAAAPFAVQIHPAVQNLGIAGNFERAICLCSGGIIALSDQDDVWLPHKLERLNTALSVSGTGFAFSDAELVDESLKPLDKRLWQSIGFDAREQAILRTDAPRLLLKHRVVTGATMAFRAEYRDKFLPISPLWIHDGWIALIIALYAGAASIAEPLIQYRQHGRNQVGAAANFGEALAEASSRGRASYVRNREQYIALRDHIRDLADVPHKSEVLRLVDEKIAHITARAALPDNRLGRIPAVLNELLHGRYHRFSAAGLRSAAKDLLVK